MNLTPPPDHSRPKWKNQEWFKEDAIEYVRAYFHDVIDYIGVHSNEFYELNIIIDGHGWHYMDNRYYEVSPGSVIVVPPYTSHGYMTQSTMNIFHALIKYPFFEQYDYELRNMPGYTILFEIEPYIRIEARKTLCLALSKDNYYEIVPHLHNLVKLEQSKYKGRDLLKNIFTLYLIGLISASISNIYKYRMQKISDYNSMLIARSMEYIRINFSKKLVIDELAAKVNMSRSAYLRYFRKVSGKSPASFIALCRVAYAKKLLCYTKKQISFIAQECGFYDSSHFARVFKSVEGINPSQFRTIYKGKVVYPLCSLCSCRVP